MGYNKTMNMTARADILMIVGPGGSGKSTLAQRVANDLGWKYIEEDRYWVNAKFDSGLRTPEQERTIQARVIKDLQASVDHGTGVVLEFILYKTPPNPLTAYREFCNQASIQHRVVALAPSTDEIIKRMRRRGRENDLADMEGRRRDAEHQLACLEADYIRPYVIDTSSVSIEELSRHCQKVINQ